MRIISFLFAALFCVQVVTAQKHFTKNGSVSFFSKTDMENIDAHNNQVVCILTPATGELQFSLLVKNFHFEKALMEEHFNENYMESDKFPKSTFKGTYTPASAVNYTKDGVYPVTVSGDLTMHGVTKRVTATGSITVKGSTIKADSKFNVKLADFDIKVPKLVEANISPVIDITVACMLDQKM